MVSPSHRAAIALCLALGACVPPSSLDAGAGPRDASDPGDASVVDRADPDAPLSDGALPDEDEAARDASALDAVPTDAPPNDARDASIPEPIAADAVYVAPDGSDANDGSARAPFATLVRAWRALGPGRTLYLRGGVYRFSTQQYVSGRSGTAAAMIRVWAYPGERPVLTAAADYTGQDLVYFEGAYVHFRGLEIRDFRPRDYGWTGFRSDASQHCVYEQFDYHHNRAGMAIRHDSNDNLIVRSDFHHNADPEEDFDGADGLDVTYIRPGYTNTIRECRAYWNGDDGFDAWDNNGRILIERSWAFYNGYIPDTFETAGNGAGFKLGEASPTREIERVVRQCVAYRNRLWGFVENDARVGTELFNNTSVRNGGRNFWFGSWDREGAADDHPIVVRNNIAFGPAGPELDDMAVTFADFSTLDRNSWMAPFVVDERDFESLDETELRAPRGADGSLPTMRFLHLAATSDMVNAGTDVGLAYDGRAPDLGAFER